MSGYMVNDAPRAIAFYRDALGLEPVRLYPDNRGAEYDLGDGTTFGLWGGGGIPVVIELETPNCRMAAINDSEGNTIFLHERKAR